MAPACLEFYYGLSFRSGLRWVRTMTRSDRCHFFAAFVETIRRLRGPVLLLPMLGLALLARAAEPKTNAFYQAESTRRMAERLEQIARTVDPLGARFLAAGQVE